MYEIGVSRFGMGSEFLVLDISSREVKRGDGGELLLFLIGV